jgi:hypothetical protein
MSSTSKPRVELDNIDPTQALQCAVGEYLIQFAMLETTVTIQISVLLSQETTKTLFMMREVFVAVKVKLLRRAAVSKYGEDATAKLRGILNRIVKASEFRNDLVHGAYISVGGGGDAITAHGKLGKSPTILMDGMDPIDHKKIQSETQLVTELAVELFAAVAELKFSSSKSLDTSGSGS